MRKLLVVVALAACRNGTSSGVAPAIPTSDATVSASPPVIDAAAPTAAAPLLLAPPIEIAHIRSAHSIGHTSVVFKVREPQGDGSERVAAFKVAAEKGAVRYRSEIAAYQLAQLWNISHVSPAYLRRVSKAELARVLRDDPKGTELLGTRALVGSDGMISGAWIPWIDALSFLPMEKEPLRSQWTGWLTNAPLPTAPSEMQLARETSQMLLFDHLTANWDRFSGGNVGLGRAAEGLLFIDNDGAFVEPEPDLVLTNERKQFQAIKRFSRSFVVRLRETKMDVIRQALLAPDKVPLLSDLQLKGIERRRLATLSHIADLVEQQGDAATFPFE